MDTNNIVGMFIQNICGTVTKITACSSSLTHESISNLLISDDGTEL